MAKFNYSTFYFDSNVVALREAELPAANFRDGGNAAGSNACGIGFGTGDKNWKVQDYPIPSPNAIQRSQYIGSMPGFIVPTAISVGAVEGPASDQPTSGRGLTPEGANALITPVLATGAVVDGGDVETVEGFVFTNQTGAALVAGDRVFGVAANP
jgi:hypothetical protein